MISLANFNSVEEATSGNGGSKLPAGGYVCKVCKVTDVTDKQYLEIEFDIAEGEHQFHFTDLDTRFGFWGLTSRRSYKESAIPFFKRMCSAINNSNNGYSFNPFVAGGNADEQSLVNKLVGLVLREEEYEKNNGDIGTRLAIAYECPVDKIRKGDFKVPEKKVINKPIGANINMSIPATDAEDIPF